MPHYCYACAAANPDYIFRYAPDGATARIPDRFRGPPGSANGGIAAGALACIALHAREQGVARRQAADAQPAVAVSRIVARLRLPVPVERDLSVSAQRNEGGGYEVALADNGETLIPGTVEFGEPPPLAPERATALREMALVAVPDKPPFYEETGDHPIPRCFSCGPDHESGLHIIPRYVSDGLIASSWRPPKGAFDDGDGALSPMIVASALDCSSGICMPLADQRALLAEDLFFLLGSLDLRFLRRAPAGGEYRVIGRALARDGRKFYGMSALFDGHGTAYATAEAIWIVAPVTRAAAFGAA